MTTPSEIPSPAAAVAALLARIAPVATERIPLASAGGRILAQDIAADRPSPAVTVSAMDGYAVRAADAALADRLPISAHARIGREPPPLPPGAAVHIVTGAPLPAGADAVIRREDVTEEPGAIRLSDAARHIRPGAALRRAGENAPAGECILRPGSELTPAAIAALAAFGIANPLVYRRVRIAILTTGDELVDASQSPTPWQLRDSNGPALAVLLARCAYFEALPHPRIPDDPAATRAAIARALDSADAVLATGGVSMGDRDFIPSSVRALGGHPIFHKIPQRPGRPMFAAAFPNNRVFLGLPGNPVSVLVTARRIAIPALQAVGGLAPSPPPLIPLHPDGKRIDLWWHRLVRIAADGYAEFADNRGSGDIPAAASTDGFVEVPPNQESAHAPFYAWNA